MLQNSPLASWVKGLPEILQYVVVIGIVLAILYLCLLLTRLLGQKHGEKVTYDNPEEYQKQVPDLFASTMFRRKQKDKKDKE